MAGGPPALPPEITSLLFFYDNFKNSDEAAEYVVEHDKGPGTFLLRPSTRNPSSLTLTISIENRHARHVNVQRLPDIQSATGYTFFIIPERPFPTFRDLYAYYTRNAICNLEQVSNVKLLSPLNRPQQSGVSSQRSSRNNSFSQQLLPGEIPPLPSRKSSSSSNMSVSTVVPDAALVNGRASFESGGNATPRTSGSSTGSVNVADVYFAPGSPGSLKSTNSPPPVPAPLTKKDIKKLEKQKKKEDKEREKEEKKARKEEKKSRKMNGDMVAEVNNMGELGWCRPPMPTPAASDLPADDEPPYYSSPRPYKNHLEELKRMLRESEICDCGLKMIDAELVGGWTVHRSRESATFKRVFYQHENGSTTWNFPTDIEDLLSVQQVDFIVRLCSEAGQPIPDPVYRRYQAIKTARESRRSYIDQYGPRPGPQF